MLQQDAEESVGARREALRIIHLLCVVSGLGYAGSERITPMCKKVVLKHCGQDGSAYMAALAPFEYGRHFALFRDLPWRANLSKWPHV